MPRVIVLREADLLPLETAQKGEEGDDDPLLLPLVVRVLPVVPFMLAGVTARSIEERGNTVRCLVDLDLLREKVLCPIWPRLVLLIRWN